MSLFHTPTISPNRVPRRSDGATEVRLAVTRIGPAIGPGAKKDLDAEFLTLGVTRWIAKVLEVAGFRCLGDVCSVTEDEFREKTKYSDRVYSEVMRLLGNRGLWFASKPGKSGKKLQKGATGSRKRAAGSRAPLEEPPAPRKTRGPLRWELEEQARIAALPVAEKLALPVLRIPGMERWIGSFPRDRKLCVLHIALSDDSELLQVQDMGPASLVRIKEAVATLGLPAKDELSPEDIRKAREIISRL